MISLYIHVPFCVRKCHYCGFYSTHYTQEAFDAYILALRKEAKVRQGAFSGSVFDSLYIGGGTPTVLSPEQLGELLGIVREHFQVAPGAEMTIEANPGTVSEDKLELLHASGLNRLSLGVQSFSDHVLRTLGRLHSAVEAYKAVMLSRKAGFANISVDLIYGIPGQSMAEWNETLTEAISLAPKHVSAYSLSLDEGSRFIAEAEAGRFALPDDELVAEMYEIAVSRLRGAGYERYEISNFAFPGFACLHNSNYWERGEYLGLGPGAWSFVGNARYRTIADVREYARLLKAGYSVIAEEEIIDSRRAANETVMLGLRTSCGVDMFSYGQRYGAEALEQLSRKAGPLIDASLLIHANGRLMLAERGFLVANEALARLAV
ncbi:MAG TPA: radical SAM family heme chaperone HemW [Nitrospirota bacterium]|nr:radical SAM family heme chaperone HemW [Nitrospirota bacterium]